MQQKMVVAAVALALLASGCDFTKKGLEGGRCLDDDTCQGELSCLSGRCVKVPGDFFTRKARAKTGGKGAPALDAQAAVAGAIAALRKIGAGARQFYVMDHFDRTGTLQPRTFPPGAAGWVPASSCCTVSDGVCSADAAQWQASPWKTLGFAVLDPHRYQYRFISSNEGAAATFTAEARGDLDCDGKRSLFRLTGKVSADGAVVTSRISRKDELE